MKKEISSLLLLVLLIFSATNAFAAQVDSSNYKQIVIMSEGGENMSSTSYKTGIAVGIINGIITSASYINKLGFFHTWLLANDQPCTSASQCEGGFCCSNLCKSSACPSPGGGTGGVGGEGAAVAGGGGGGYFNITPPEKEAKLGNGFSVSPSSIKEHIALGDEKTNSIVIRNTGNSALSFKLKVLTIDSFVSLSQSSFSLSAGDEQSIDINIIGKKIGSYIGEIEIESEGIKKSVIVVLEIESEQVLFDAKLDIPADYKEVKAGGELKAQITLLNVGPPRKVDVTTTFIIKDTRGTIIDESSETFAVEKQTSFVKSFKIPSNLQPGNYLAVVEVRYEKSFAVSSELFRVVGEEGLIVKVSRLNITFISILLTLVVILSLLLYLLMSRGNVLDRVFSKRHRKRK